MKIAKEFVLREIADEYVIVPVGATAMDFNGIITVNEVGKFLWEQLQEESTEESLVQKILEEYEVDEITAKEDVAEFLKNLKEGGILSC